MHRSSYVTSKTSAGRHGRLSAARFVAVAIGLIVLASTASVGTGAAQSPVPTESVGATSSARGAEATSPATSAAAPRAYGLGLSATTATITATQVATLKAQTSPVLTNQRYIYLYSSLNGRTWSRAGRMIWSSSARRYILRKKPTAHTYYRARWYDGAGRVRAISPKVRVYVRVRLRFYSTNYRFAWGRRVRFFGSVWPNHYRKRVRIQTQSGGRWLPLMWADLSRSGAYSTRLFKPRRAGSFRVRAVFIQPDWNHLGTAKGPKTLTAQQSGMAPEGRAVWVTRFDYRSRRQIARIMRNAWEANLNTVYLQVRGQGDAYYASHYEPWAARLTATSTNPKGTLGRNPGWDPLAYAISAAHSYGLKLHVWVNTYPIWMGTSAPSSSASPRHIYYTGGPGWRVASRYRYNGTWRYRTQRLNAGYLYGSPGNGALRSHIRRVVLDIASNYDVDGIHLDKVRYPGRQYSFDYASRTAFEDYKRVHGADTSRASWQRLQVDALVRDVYNGVKDINPEIQVSAASYGLYTNRFKYRAVHEGLGDYYENSQGWLASVPGRGPILDTLVPQVFWDRGHTPAWSTLVGDFTSHRNGRNIYAGIASYMYRSNWGELAGQVAASRSLGAQGVSFFDYQSLGGRWQRLDDIFPEMVETPTRGEHTEVRMMSRTASPTVGEEIGLICFLAPRVSGAHISVLRYTGTSWQLVGTGTTDSFGECTVPFTPTSAGRHVLRAIYKGDGTYGGSTSPRVVVDAQP